VLAEANSIHRNLRFWQLFKFWFPSCPKQQWVLGLSWG